MRRILSLPVIAVSMAFANPVHAAEEQPEAEMIEKLNDPDFQDGLVKMMSGMMTVMMDFPIGQMASTMEKALPEEMKEDDAMSGIDPDATVADLVGRDDPDFEENIEDKMRKGTAMMGIMASEFGALLPELRAMGEKMKRRMEDLDR